MIAGTAAACQESHARPFAPLFSARERHKIRQLPRVHRNRGECFMTCKLASLVVASLLLMPATASAQQSASSGLVGQVTDSSQAAIPGATVTVTNVGTNAQRTTVTDGEGRFSVPALPPATYHIKVELQGFRTAELQNFVLRQGETARPAITLGIATVSESVTVTGEAPLLQTQSASVGQVINEKQIERPAVERPHRAVARLALGRCDAAKLRAQHPVRHAGTSSSPSRAGATVPPTTRSTACTCGRCVSTTCR